jgi:SAM-dependent methyltransferase
MLKKTTKFGVLAMPNGDITPSFCMEKATSPCVPVGSKALFEYLERQGDLTYDRAKDASLAERARLSANQKANLTYGEATYDTIDTLVQIIQTHARKEGRSGEFGIFYDIGSGGGRVTLMAASLGCFEQCLGVEIMDSLHACAVDAKRTWDSLPDDENRSTSVVDFYHGSLTDKSVRDWSDADVVYVNCTCFQRELFLETVALASEMKSGSYLITLSDKVPEEYGFKEIAEVRLAMSWAEADIFVNVRV